MSSVLVITLAVSLALTPLVRRLAIRCGAVAVSGGLSNRGIDAVPRWGGLAVFPAMAVGIAAALWSGAPPQRFGELAWVVLITASFVCLLGCIDDRRGLPMAWRPWLQIAAVTPVVLACWRLETLDVVDRVVVSGHRVELGWLGVPMTMLWLIACMNGLTLLDRLHGLASVAGLASATALVVLASVVGHGHVALAAVALGGALAGFLVYNLPPARIQLGKSGCMLVGLVVGILSIQASLTTAATLTIGAKVGPATPRRSELIPPRRPATLALESDG